jgi:hypothetical protein
VVAANALARAATDELGLGRDDLVKVTWTDGTERQFDELRTAMQVANNDGNVWRVSFPFQDDRVRLVRRFGGPDLGDLWSYEPVVGPDLLMRLSGSAAT